jgi:hypothetical protein
VITVTGPVWLWNAERGSWHFLTVPAEQAAEIRVQTMGARSGFGSVRVLAAIGAVSWRTSLFPDSKSGGYVLPIKAEVRRQMRLSAGECVAVQLEPII